MSDSQTEKFKETWCSMSCTLNGHPARVTGRRCRFAIIVTTEEPYLEAEYTWFTVDMVMRRDGKFRL